MERVDGFAFFSGNTPLILYDQDNAPHRIRFTAAHELGHIVLGHVVPGDFSVARRSPSRDRYEAAADQFAERILAPACVLWGLGLHEPELIAKACNISLQAAEKRAKRMETLYQRDRFLSAALEQDLFRQFLPFIMEARRHPEGR